MTDNSNGSSAGNDNLAFRAALARGLVSRRSAMMGAAGLALRPSSPRAAQRDATRPPPTEPAAPPLAKAAQDLSDTEKVVNWSNWTEYIDVTDDGKSRPSIDAFTKATGIKVNYTEDYLDNDEFYAKVRPCSRAARTPVATSGAPPTGWWRASSARATSRSSTWPTSPTRRT